MIQKLYEEHHKKSRDIEKTFCEKQKLKTFKNIIQNTKNKRILEIGCRAGYLLNKFDNSNEKYGIDVDKRALESAKKKGIKVKNINITDYDKSFEKIFNLEEKFDLIIASDVLEHLYTPDKVISNINKSLKKEGLFIGNVPNAFFLKHRIRYLFGKREHTPLNDPTHITQFNFLILDKYLKKEFKNIKYFSGFGKSYDLISNISKNLLYYNIFFIIKK